MFEWEKYYRLAKKLQQQNTLKEACQRSAISRTYYFLHNKAEQYYEAHDEITSEFTLSEIKHNHGNLIETFKGQSDNQLSRLGTVLGRAFRRRKECDYDKGLSFDLQQESRKLLKRVKVVVNKIN